MAAAVTGRVVNGLGSGLITSSGVDPRRSRRTPTTVPGIVRFAFYGRMSTEDFQDFVTSRAWRRNAADELVAGKGAVVVGEYERAFFSDQLIELLPVFARHGVRCGYRRPTGCRVQCVPDHPSVRRLAPALPPPSTRRTRQPHHRTSSPRPSRRSGGHRPDRLAPRPPTTTPARSRSPSSVSNTTMASSHGRVSHTRAARPTGGLFLQCR
jgi:hypothetical protein